MQNQTIAVIGLGYVGLPLAVEFGKKYATIGFDINKNRIEELNKGEDYTCELTKEEILTSKHLIFTSDLEQIRWETPFLNPQSNVEKRFYDNISTRILEKDYYVPIVPVSINSK